MSVFQPLTPFPKHVALPQSRLLTLLLCGLVFCGLASAQTGYTGIFGGGPLYKHNNSYVNEVKNSGFTEVIVWSVEISASGDLNLNGEFPLTSGGTYVGNKTYPNFASDLATLKQGSVRRITLSIGSSNVGDFQHLQSLVNSQGTGSNSILYRDFQAIKAALPSVDAIDLDDENDHDASSTTAFSVMLGNLGFHVVPDAYNDNTYWTSLVSQINSQRAGTVDAVHLQVYSGGAGNNPCSGWDFGSVPVYPGLWDQNDSPSEVQSTMSAWHSQCGISGGFLWLYDDIAGSGQTSQYANAITTGVQ